MSKITEEDFHQALHGDLGKPYVPPERKHSRFLGHPASRGAMNRPDSSHSLDWAKAKVNLRTSLVDIRVRLKYKPVDIDPNKISFSELKGLANKGISQLWSGTIKVGKRQFKVKVSACHRQGPKTLPMRLRFSPAEEGIEPSYNPSMTWLVEPMVTYNELPGLGRAEAEASFKRQAAHELGHSVLAKADSHLVSWMHKGTSQLWQTPMPWRPDAASQSQLDLMSYYNSGAAATLPTTKFRKKKASEEDLKKLIWGAQLEWV